MEELVCADALDKCLFVVNGDIGPPPSGVIIEAKRWRAVARSNVEEAFADVLLIMDRLKTGKNSQTGET
jgi:hypothetical protein